MAERNMMTAEEIRMETMANNTPMQFDNVSSLQSIAKVITDEEIERELQLIKEIQTLSTQGTYNADQDTILQGKKKELFEKQENQKIGIFEIPIGTIAFSNFNSVSIDNNYPVYIVQHRNITQDIYQNGFYEIVGKEVIYQGNTYRQRHIRPYLDIDMKKCIENNISGHDLFSTIIRWCDQWKAIFGNYSVSAYTNSPTLSKDKNIRYNKESEKHLSMHIVFYECKMEIEEFKYLWEPEFFDIPIGLFDKSVYDGLLSRRTMRFHLSPKKKFENSPLVHDCGRILDDKPYSTQFITPSGTEKVVCLHQVIESKLWFKEKEVIEKTEDRTAMHNSNMSLELFEALVNGFDKSIEIHAEQGTNCFKIITALNACENEHISAEKIEEAKNYICYHANLTSKASLRFWEIDSSCDRKGRCANSAGFLYKIIKEKRPDYFKDSILPLIAPKTQFVSSNYTFNDYLMHYQQFTTTYQHFDALAKCIAVNVEAGGYIRKSNNGNNVVYQLISCGCIKKEFNKKIVLPTTEKQKEKMRDQKKKIQDFKEYKLWNIIQDAEVAGKLTQYNGMSLIPKNSTVLWQYRPPTGIKYDKALIEEWLAFMKSRVVHERPLMEELYSHAIRFRKPTEFNEKFFIHYESEGNSGKSFLVGCLGLLYPKLASIGLTPELITEMYCSLFSQNLLVWMEEAEKGSDYGNTKLQTAIKRITTREGYERRMRTDTTSTEYTAIPGMNTNDPTLYGLIRADKATISRMVIVEFKKTIYTPAQFRKIADYYTKNDAFAYSLYRYLKEDLEIPKDFTTSRYDGAEKYAFIERAQGNNRNNFELYLEFLVRRFDEQTIYDPLTKQTFRKGDYIYGSRDIMIRNYRKFNDKNTLSEDRICSALTDYGWEYKKIRVGKSTQWVYIIEYNKFREFLKDKTEDDTIDEDFCIDEAEEDNE